ncbi:hypothetical protein AB8Q18_06280 [Neisseriaceae bacterium CLB008]
MPQMTGIFRMHKGVAGNEVTYTPIPNSVIIFTNTATSKEALRTETSATGAFNFTIPAGRYLVNSYVKGGSSLVTIGGQSGWEVLANSPKTAFQDFIDNPDAGDVDGALLDQFKQLATQSTQGAIDAGVARDDAQQAVADTQEIVNDFQESISQKIDDDDETKLASEAALGKVNVKAGLAKEKADLVGIQANNNANSIIDVQSSISDLESNKANVYVGMQSFLPWRPSDLPLKMTGWYAMNGDNVLLSSRVGQALNGLPQTYKDGWSIKVTGVNINVPNWFHADGRGYHPRASLTPGARLEDAGQRIIGGAYFRSGGGWSTVTNATGAFYSTTGSDTARSLPVSSDTAAYNSNGVGFDSERVGRTANETRGMSLGLLPIIYLGV